MFFSVCLFSTWLHLSSGAFLHSTTWVSVKTLSLSARQRLHLLLCETSLLLSLSLFLQVQSPPCTRKHSCKPSHVPGSSAGWNLPLQWQNTPSSVSDMSHPSALDHMLHSSIVRFRQTVGTLRYFLLYSFWISSLDTMASPSLWCKSRVYSCLWLYRVCVWRVCTDRWKHCRIKMKKKRNEVQVVASC